MGKSQNALHVLVVSRTASIQPSARCEVPGGRTSEHRLPTLSFQMLIPFGRTSVNNLQVRVSLLEAQPQRTDQLLNDGEINNSLNVDSLFAMPEAIPKAEVGDGIDDNSTGIETRLRQIYPGFLLPENGFQSFQTLMRAGNDEYKSPEGFASLVPQDMLRFALENTFDEIAGICPIFDLPTLHRLNTEQQAASSAHPAGNSTRWAILNTWIAMGMRLRTALGSEDAFSQAIKSYYRNAILVLPNLILESATVDTIRALFLMAAFAELVEDHRSFVMLVTNAIRQIELLALQFSGVSDKCERVLYQRLLSFARLQDRKVAEQYGLALMLNSSSTGGLEQGISDLSSDIQQAK